MTLPVGEIVCGDCAAVMAQWPAGCVDAVITDPPYGLRFMGKRWDYDVPSVELWREVYRVLKDGGRLLSFAGSRTWHRMVCNIEDAGFTIEDTVLWLYAQGFPKHGSKLKPAFEPVCVARKGSVSLLNIDAARIVTDEDTRRNAQGGDNGLHGSSTFRIRERRADDHEQPAGRWPANVVLSPEAAAMLDAQSGVSETSKPGCVFKRATAKGYSPNALGAESRAEGEEMIAYGDSGGASRFFYCSKADSAERNAGCDDFYWRIVKHGHERITLAEWRTLPERERAQGNIHSTVKPVDLMRWLISLVAKQGDIVLDPFMGSGTTGVAANIQGVAWIGIERDPDYCAIAKARTAQRGIFTATTAKE